MATSERRCAPTEFEVRARKGDSAGAVVEGHAAVFERLSQNLGGFVERIAPNAFDRSLGDNPDVRALINHDPSMLLGRTRSGTLRLSKDSLGLAYEIDVPDRQDARDLLVSMDRGDISHSSFAFYVMLDGDEWSETEQGMPLRTLTALSIHNGDVSPVTYPAYEDTDSGVAGRAFKSLAEARSLDVAAIRAAAESGTLGDLISGAIEPPATEDLGDTRSSAAAARARQLDLLQAERPWDLG
jgi:HK97 family phage prohead protease